MKFLESKIIRLIINILFLYLWSIFIKNTIGFFPFLILPESDPQIIFDRNYQDKYNDPGDLVMVKNEFGRNIVHQKNGIVSLISDGFTKEGQFPMLYSMNSCCVFMSFL